MGNAAATSCHAAVRAHHAGVSFIGHPGSEPVQDQVPCRQPPIRRPPPTAKWPSASARHRPTRDKVSVRWPARRQPWTADGARSPTSSAHSGRRHRSRVDLRNVLHTASSPRCRDRHPRQQECPPRGHASLRVPSPALHLLGCPGRRHIGSPCLPSAASGTAVHRRRARTPLTAHWIAHL